MNNLISALIEQNAISKDNVVTATYTVRDGVGRTLQRTGQFGIVHFERTDTAISFTLQHVIEKSKIKVDDDNIIAIDGMELERYADVYDLNVDGSKKKMGKKRGRKPKST